MFGFLCLCLYLTLLGQIQGWEVSLTPDEDVVRAATESCNCSGDFPRITVAGTMTNPRAYTIVDSDILDVHVTNPVLYLFCTAPYPLEFVFQDYPSVNDNLRTWNINITRTFHDMGNTSSYEYEAQLFFRFRPPSEFPSVICRATMEPKTLGTTVACTRKGSYMRLSVTPNLGKIQEPASSRYGLNPNCSIDLTYNAKTHKICCPTRNTTFFNRGCSDPPSCEGFYTKTTCKQNINYNNAHGDPSNCMDGTTDLAEYGNAGVVVCSKDSKNSERDHQSATIPYFTSLISSCEQKPGTPPTRPKIYTDLENPPDLSEFLEICEPPNDPIYVSESVEFQCHGSYYMFSSGYRWALKRKHNGSDQILDYQPEIMPSSKLPSEKWLIKTSRKLLTTIQFNDTSIYEVRCYAPVWNSYDWVHKSVRVHVKKPVPIKFDGGGDDQVETLEPDKIINCSATGEPMPTLHWESIPEWGQVVESPTRSWIAIVLPNDTSELEDDVLRCKAVQGRIDKEAVKQFRLEQEDESYLIPIISVSILLGCIVLGTIVILKKYQDWKRQTRQLNQEEIKDFLEGRPDLLKSTPDFDATVRATSLPFDKTYEIQGKALELGDVIGQGHFCIVRKCVVKAPNTRALQGAAKTVKPFSDIEILKALLTELKLQIFIGPHENVVRLLGAQIKHIYKRELYIVNEFCKNGNLLEYIRKNRVIILSNYDPYGLPGGKSKNSTYIDCSTISLSFINLLKWARDIAKGMEFLSSKKVIHGDLAARNILLDKNLTAKVADFGLSVQLVDYYTYIQSSKVELPWKWLAPECLQNKEFSIQSDVWSYGVTLWEIFSLGGTPWNELGKVTPEELLDGLKRGQRMSRPDFASNEIYRLMLSCWGTEKEDRPSFTYLYNAFCSLIPNNCTRSNGYVTLDFSKSDEELKGILQITPL